MDLGSSSGKYVAVTSFASLKSNFILLKSLKNHLEKDNSKMAQLKYIGYCGVDYQILE